MSLLEFFRVSMKPSLIVLMFFIPTFLANSTLSVTYLDWEMEDSVAGGHITINDFPEILEFNLTYQVQFIISLEWLDWGDSLEFQLIQWILDFNENTNSIILGYSTVDAVLKKHEKVTTFSHWSLPEKLQEIEGSLKMNTTVILRNSTSQLERKINTIQLIPAKHVYIKNKTHLTLSLSTSTCRQGEKIFAIGSLVPVVKGATIDLTYIKPNGEEVIRHTIINSQGNFSDEYIPSFKGIWNIRASWTGTKFYASSMSNLIVFEVTSPSLLIPAIVFFGFLLYISVLEIIRRVWKQKPEEIFSTRVRAS